MSSAKASGASASNNNGTARSRDHNQGNQGRSYTVEQKAAVLRIRRCKPTAFYDILALEEVRKTCSDSDIKKAYRKQSLLTHPDKNGHEHADEAFKMVSRAFGVLGDKEKREKYDRFGTDPDSRFESARAQNPFSGFAQRNAAGGGAGGGGGGGGWFDGDPRFGEEISPEEMFRRFFGGGGFAGGFDTGPQFVFNMGGGPGIRVHQFGGGRPRRRPQNGEQQPEEGSIFSNLIGLLPILFLFIIPLISSILSGGGPQMPDMVFDEAQGPYKHKATIPEHNVDYFVREQDWAQFKGSGHKVHQLHQHALVTLVKSLRHRCNLERNQEQRLRDAAQGWFFQDPEKMKVADSHKKPACDRLGKMGVSSV